MASEWEVAGSTLRAVSEAAFLVSVSVIFPLGALLLNSLLWRARLVPRIISGWGFAGGVILLCGSTLELFDMLPAVPAGGLEAALAGPIAVQEMALAFWLIAKGFSSAAGRAAADGT
jgi:hypothetical protein